MVGSPFHLAATTPTDPSRPAVLLCTLPMYGSRLLFRGYGSNQRLRVVDAAMAGTDSLVLLDEAHLAPHLKALLPALAGCTPGAHATLGEARSTPRIAALTATGEAAGGGGGSGSTSTTRTKCTRSSDSGSTR